MKISQLITQLQKLHAMHGDLPVIVPDLSEDREYPCRKDEVSDIEVGDFRFLNIHGDAVVTKSIQVS